MVYINEHMSVITLQIDGLTIPPRKTYQCNTNNRMT